MNPFDLDPERIGSEMLEFNRRLAEGIVTLAGIPEPDGDGVSEKTVVYSEDRLRLYHYRPLVRDVHAVPLLIVYALVNRPYMTDLQEDRSLIRRSLEAGLDVYLLDWGYPDETDRCLGLDDYINGYLDRCVDEVRRLSGQDRINLLGICQGGTFSLCYAALYQHKLRNLVTTVTPVDFHTDADILSALVRKVDVDLTVEALGNIPGTLLNTTFMMLKPYRLTAQKYLDLVGIMHDPDRLRDFMAMEKWIFDSPDQAGLAWREFIRDFYQLNRLVKAEIQIGARRVDLETITLPVLNIYARDDHLVPPDASRALAGCLGTTDYTEMEFPGGHIGIYVGSRARQLPATIADWLRAR